jgi:hypothetical protein
MALRIDLDRFHLEGALQQAIASLKRAEHKTGINPLMLDIIRQDIAKLVKAMHTITEIK